MLILFRFFGLLFEFLLSKLYMEEGLILIMIRGWWMCLLIGYLFLGCMI